MLNYQNDELVILPDIQVLPQSVIEAVGESPTSRSARLVSASLLISN